MISSSDAGHKDTHLTLLKKQNPVALYGKFSANIIDLSCLVFSGLMKLNKQRRSGCHFYHEDIYGSQKRVY
jgi:hypothetical protein